MASLREFSRVMGIGLLTVQNAIKQGNITAYTTKGSNPKKLQYDIDVEKASEEYLAYTKKKGPQTRGERDGVGVVGGHDIPEKYKSKIEPAVPRAETPFQKARGVREIYAAKMLHQKFLLESRALVPVDQVKKLFYDIAKTVQQNLLNIPARIAPLVAAELDEKKVNDMLDIEIVRALETLSEASLESLTK